MMRRHGMVLVAVIDAGVLCLLFAAAASSKSFGGSETPAAAAGYAQGQATPMPAQPSPYAGGGAQGQAQPVPYTAGGGGASSSAATGEPESGLDQKAIDNIVAEHNVFRAREKVPPLSWNATLAQFSQEWAETLKSDKGCQMVHSTSPYGENLLLSPADAVPLTWRGAIDLWSGEKSSYHYGPNTCDPGKMCGHYLAVVWKDTTTVGCGRVKCNNGDTLDVCSYWPPGNVIGARPY